jgi:hypothetical protein
MKNRQPVTICNTSQKPDSPPAKPPRIPPTKLTTLAEIRTELAKLYRDCRAGRVDPSDGTKLAFILGEIRKIITDTPEVDIQNIPAIALKVYFDDHTPATVSEFQTAARKLMNEI